jgi:D-inositol-3-phosphate glycosyltransferase
VRIAVISAHTSPLARPGGAKSGGLNVYVLELARRLAAQGCHVDIFTRATSPPFEPVVQEAPNLRVVNLVAGPLAPLAPEALHGHLDAFYEALLGFTAESASYDLVHSHYWLSGLVGARLKDLWRVPHVVMFHTLGEIKNRASYGEHETPLRIDAEAEVLRSADRVICATQQEATSLRQLYDAREEQIAVIPLGVDLERFRPVAKRDARNALGLTHDERIILFVGRIEPLKGLDILINAAALLESDVECSVLVVGGDEASQPQVDELTELARDRGIEHRVAFVGAVDHDTLPLYYNAADVCVVPSHYESFGLVAVEAMASGVPVVASRVGGLAGTVKDGETGYLIPWLCPEPFAERIELLLENEPLRHNLGAAAREAMTRYRWENVAASVLNLYISLITPAREAPQTRPLRP